MCKSSNDFEVGITDGENTPLQTWSCVIISERSLLMSAIFSAATS
jgi:hypothetical protein